MQHYLFFDTETTGLPFKDDGRNGHTHSSNGYPRFVQLGWQIDDPQLGPEVKTKKVGYVKPLDFVMPEEVSKFNGISHDTLMEKGMDEQALLDSFITDAKAADALVGHNVIFDITVLVGRLQDLGRMDDAIVLMNKPTRDTMVESTQWCALPKVAGKRYDYEGEYKYPRLTELHNKLFGKDFNNAHDAMGDVDATSKCFYELQRRKIIP